MRCSYGTGPHPLLLPLFSSRAQGRSMQPTPVDGDHYAPLDIKQNFRAPMCSGSPVDPARAAHSYRRGPLARLKFEKSPGSGTVAGLDFDFDLTWYETNRWNSPFPPHRSGTESSSPTSRNSARVTLYGVGTGNAPS
ncbi:unnamed protein product [Diplocarpon coronariae]